MPLSSKPSVQQLLTRMEGWQSMVSKSSLTVLSRIQRCHTASLGYHAYRCSDSGCGAMQYVYHSCRNIEARLQELLPVKYYHVVFTVPHQLNALIMGNRKQMFELLYGAASYTLLKFGCDEQYLGAQPGIIAVLHTWGQQLSFHPHLHCIVSGGGITKDGNWKDAVKAKHGVLFPTSAMKPVYKARFLKLLQQAIDEGKIKMNEQQRKDWLSLRTQLYNTQWIVDSRQPMGGPQQVVEYLGRYTHKVAISNHRIKRIDSANNVTFQYKDYADGCRKKMMTLSGQEFLRRFEQHLLPKGFCKIRYYGYLGNYRRRERVNDVLQQMGKPQHPAPVQISEVVRRMEKYGAYTMLCPCCKTSPLELMYIRYTNNEIKEVLKE